MGFMIAPRARGLVGCEPVGQHPVEDAEQMGLLLVGQFRPDRRPGRGRPARGGAASGRCRGMVRVLRQAKPAVARTSGPVPGAPTGPRRPGELYSPELHPLRLRGSVGSVFVFKNRRGDKLKILAWMGDGFALYLRRLERGTFAFPTANDAGVLVTPTRLAMILGGLDPAKTHERRRYKAPA